MTDPLRNIEANLDRIIESLANAVDADISLTPDLTREILYALVILRDYTHDVAEMRSTPTLRVVR